MDDVRRSHFEEQRAKYLNRVRRSGVPNAVAHLFAAVQEPRCDDEPSTPTFDEILGDERQRLRARINAPTSDSSMLDADGFGGLLETEATISANRLLTAAKAAGMTKATRLLSAVLERCNSISQQRNGTTRSSPFPEHERIVDPQTGRPIGMWR